MAQENEPTTSLTLYLYVYTANLKYATFVLSWLEFHVYRVCNALKFSLVTYY